MTAVAERKAEGPAAVEAAALEKVLIKGDLSALTEAQRVAYYKLVCSRLGLEETTQPFQYIVLSGRLTLYARRDATDQLRRLRGVSITGITREVVEGCYVVTARATDREGRTDESIGAVAIEGLKGDARAVAMMKAETKSKRRVTLSICGLGLLDETEVQDIPDTTRQVSVPPLPVREALPAPWPGAPRGDVTEQQLARLVVLCQQTGYGKDDLTAEFPGLVSRTQLSKAQASSLIESLEARAAEAERETAEERAAVASEGGQ